MYGLSFFFYSREHLPIHVHIRNADDEAKFQVFPEMKLVANKGLNVKDIKKATLLVEEYVDFIIEKWKEFHGE